MSKQQDAHLLSGAYALDAVTPEEAALVEAAMRDSEELRGEVVGLIDTAVALGSAVSAAAPPPALRARLLAAIEDLPQHPADPAEDEADEPAPASAVPAGRHVVPRRRRRRSRVSAMLLAGVTAAALLFFGGSLLQRAVLQPQTDYTDIQLASDVQRSSAKVAGGGIAQVSWSHHEGRTAVVLTGVKVPQGKALQLWNLRGGRATSEGLYEPQGEAGFTLLDRVPVDGEQLAVTVEPTDGSKQPTTPPIVRVTLSA